MQPHHLARHARRGLLAAAAAALLMPGARASDAYPTRPITLVVPFVAGGTTDVMGRAIAKSLSAEFGQPVLVDNRPGGGATIGANLVAKAAPDGYTLLLTSISLAINAGLRPKLPYDTLADLQPVTQVASLPLVLVTGSSLQAKTVKELVATAKAKPGKLNYASSGSGTSPHLAGEMFKTTAGIDMVHVPYKGNAPVVTDLLAGHVDMHFGLVSGMMANIKAGKLRALAVTTERRIASLPDVPTIAESGYPRYEINSWQGLFAPARTPPEITQRIARAVARMLAEPEFKGMMANEGAEPVGSSPEDFTRYVGTEVAKWSRVAKESGATAD